MDISIPAVIGCRIRIIAAEGGVPAAGNTIAATVLPVDVPAINGGRAVVGDPDGRGKAAVPFVADDVIARGETLCREQCC